jgi:putative spermidine/putrescine transport system permease protein
LKPARFAYPLSWRVFDALELAAARLWPARFSRALPYLFLLPAVALVGLLVYGLVEIADSSLRTLDTNTFLLSEDRSLANYHRAFSEQFFLTVTARSLFGAVIVTAVTLCLAFPYAYLMVRSRSAALRKVLLITLFLPFFIGQVVRAYGWLIILGNQGMVNDLLGAFGLGPIACSSTTPPCFSAWFSTCCPLRSSCWRRRSPPFPRRWRVRAESLGAHWLRSFYHVVLPLAGGPRRCRNRGAHPVAEDFAIPAISAAAPTISSPTQSTISSSERPTWVWARRWRSCSCARLDAGRHYLCACGIGTLGLARKRA